MTTNLVASNDTDLGFYSSEGQKGENGSHWAKIKVFSWRRSFEGVPGACCARPFLASRGHPHSWAWGPFSNDGAPTSAPAVMSPSLPLLLPPPSGTDPVMTRGPPGISSSQDSDGSHMQSPFCWEGDMVTSGSGCPWGGERMA